MPSTNGHGPRRAILYTRVSTDEQVRHGFSLAQQEEALRAYATGEGLEVVEVVADPGKSGATLSRPGMDRVRELVAAGGVSVVLAQDRDRFAREPAYHYLLKREFAEYGTKIRALNDRGDDSAEGELMDGILDQLAKFERAKTSERSRRGKLRKAREGKVVASLTPTYGFEYNAARDGYVVDEPSMSLVRRIFRLVAEEGVPLRTIKRTFEAEGIPTPKGGKHWDAIFYRHVIQEDAYKPHAKEDIEALVGEGLLRAEVAATLDPGRAYGIWWFNRRTTVRTQVPVVGADGRREYKLRQEPRFKPRSEWVAVPVPDAGVPLHLVEAARERIKDNRRPSSAGHRVWELSGGMLRCGGCGRVMGTSRQRSSPGYPYLHYYRCMGRINKGDEACEQRKGLKAERSEGMVWGYVRGLLTEPEELHASLDRMIELERAGGAHGDPEREARAWLDKIAEVDAQRARAQDLAVEGLLSRDELRAKLTALQETREAASAELQRLDGQKAMAAELERDRDALLGSLAALAPQALDELEPEERRRVYQLLGMRFTANLDGTITAALPYGEPTDVCNSELARTCSRLAASTWRCWPP